MRNIDLLKAINNIDDKYIEEAMPLVYKQRKPSFLLKLIPTVCCMVLMTFVCISLFKGNISECFKNSESGVQTVNPVSDFETLEEAETAIGFKLGIDLSKYSNLTYSVIDGEVLEAYYESGEDYFRIRKTKGVDDISGDYSIWDSETTSKINEIDITIKEANDTKLITFSHNGYSYSISSNFLSEDNINDFIKQISLI